MHVDGQLSQDITESKLGLLQTIKENLVSFLFFFCFLSFLAPPFFFRRSVAELLAETSCR